jgi:MFS family permease
MKKRPALILPIIIISQFTGTSLWFAGNAVLDDIQRQWSLGDNVLGHITSVVQLGFIAGTLCFAVLAISDRFSPRKVFFFCSLLGAITNLLIYFMADGFNSLMVLRGMTGFFLAGIYPVGMKIASGWYRQGLGKALGFLVGALVLGTAFPHVLKGFDQSVPWEMVIVAISLISASGGALMFALVPDGPYLFKGATFHGKALKLIFERRDLRAAAFGYFGHMWELYTLWAFVPMILTTYITDHPEIKLNISLWAFTIIAAGALGCIGGGMVTKKFGSAGVAFVQLGFSGICCLLGGLILHAPPQLFLAFLIFWGIVVVGDSPQFSTLVAHTAPKELVGSALTIVNCIGFFITILSIQLMTSLIQVVPSDYLFLFLAIGPLIGLGSLLPLVRKKI